VVGGWWLVVGGWWLVVGGWWLAVGGWRLAVDWCLYASVLTLFRPNNNLLLEFFHFADNQIRICR
jgi:hypothetical protein